MEKRLAVCFVNRDPGIMLPKYKRFDTIQRWYDIKMPYCITTNFLYRISRILCD